MKLSQASDLVMSLKGAGISCLVIMWAMRKNKRNWNRNDLATHTGWSRESVAMGLERLTIRGLTLRTNFENWQLSENGFQLNFSDLPAQENPNENMETRTTSESKNSTLNGSGFKEIESYMHDKESLKPLLTRVENIDSHVVRNPIFERLENHLILCGAAPKAASVAIVEALAREKNWKRVEASILWLRGYVATQSSIKHAGNFIAASIRENRPVPIDFTLGDFPNKLFDLRNELEDLERSLKDDEADPELPS